MKTGRVKWFNHEKRIGFIAPDDGSEEHIVLRDSLPDDQTLNEGQKVSFKSIPLPKGMQAMDVKPL